MPVVTKSVTNVAVVVLVVADIMLVVVYNEAQPTQQVLGENHVNVEHYLK